MLIIGVTYDELARALYEVNRRFSGNVIFACCEFKGYAREGKEKWNVRLRVRDAYGPGARVSQTGRHLVNACWHVHGYFFDALPSGVLVKTNGTTYVTGTPWVDFSVGPMEEPKYLSQMCGCE